MYGTKPHQNKLPVQLVVVIPLCRRNRECSGDGVHFTDADTIVKLLSFGTIFCKDICSSISRFFYSGLESTAEQPYQGATCCWALARFGSLLLWYACRTERKTTCLQKWYEACAVEIACIGAFVSAYSWRSAFWQLCLLWLSVFLAAPPLATVMLSDPSVNTWNDASCGGLSAIIASVRDWFILSACMSPSERKQTLVWALMPVMSVTQGSEMSDGKRESVFWGSLSWNWWIGFLLLRTKLLLVALGETLQRDFHEIIWHVSELVCLHLNLCIPPLT